MLSRRAWARLAKEVHALSTDSSSSTAIPGIRIGPPPSAAASSSTTTSSASTETDAYSPLDNLLHLHAYLQGPDSTPYAGGHFAIALNLEAAPAFPDEPPHCTFLTPIFHPNISRTGDICVSTLKKDWRPEYGITHILLSIRSLLIAPNPDSALDPESARLLQEDYNEYARLAALWTRVHASIDKIPPGLWGAGTQTQTQAPASPAPSTTPLESVANNVRPSPGSADVGLNGAEVPMTAVTRITSLSREMLDMDRQGIRRTTPLSTSIPGEQGGEQAHVSQGKLQPPLTSIIQPILNHDSAHQAEESPSTAPATQASARLRPPTSTPDGRYTHDPLGLGLRHHLPIILSHPLGRLDDKHMASGYLPPPSPTVLKTAAPSSMPIRSTPTQITTRQSTTKRGLKRL